MGRGDASVPARANTRAYRVLRTACRSSATLQLCDSRVQHAAGDGAANRLKMGRPLVVGLQICAALKSLALTISILPLRSQATPSPSLHLAISLQSVVCTSSPGYRRGPVQPSPKRRDKNPSVAAPHSCQKRHCCVAPGTDTGARLRDALTCRCPQRGPARVWRRGLALPGSPGRTLLSLRTARKLCRSVGLSAIRSVPVAPAWRRHEPCLRPPVAASTSSDHPAAPAQGTGTKRVGHLSPGRVPSNPAPGRSLNRWPPVSHHCPEVQTWDRGWGNRGA